VSFAPVIANLGWLIAGFAGLMLAPAAVALGYGETRDAAVFAGVAAVALFFGIGMVFATQGGERRIRRRGCFLLVALAWPVLAIIGAAPFYLLDVLSTPTDAIFEAVSGLTTTGATLITGLDELGRGVVFWRAWLQWIGGFGTIVIAVSVLTMLGIGGMEVFRSAMPHGDHATVEARVLRSSAVLGWIYVTFTVACAVSLWFAGMPTFDALGHALSTVSTGGFSTRDQSIGYYPAAVHVIVIVFMVLAGVNFSLYFAVVRRKLSSVWRDPELRTYLVLMTVGSILVAGSLAGGSITTTTGEIVTGSAGEAIHYGLFTTVALSTGTGYCIADFDKWPFMAKAVLIVLMFIGGSAGSTAGGIKVIRIWMAFKVMISEIEHVFRPQVVRTVRVGNTIIDNNLKLGTLAYVLGIILLFAVGSAAVMLLETTLNPSAGCEYTTAATASLAALCNVGPGFGAVGATANYGWMTSYTKMVLSLLMALGRLEVFAIIVLFTPRFWTTE